MQPDIKWNISFGKTENNKIIKLMNKLALKEKGFHSFIVRKMEFLQSKYIDELRKDEFETVKSHKNLYELKIYSKKQFRILGYLDKDAIPIPIFYGLHAFIKKDQKIKQKEIETAIIRLEELKKTQYGLQRV